MNDFIFEHQINEKFISLGPIPIYWYSLMFLFAFGFGYMILKKNLYKGGKRRSIIRSIFSSYGIRNNYWSKTW